MWYAVVCWAVLSCWQACLDSVTDTVQQNASRWWCHIYSLIMPYTDPSSVRSCFTYYNHIFSLFLILLMSESCFYFLLHFEFLILCTVILSVYCSWRKFVFSEHHLFLLICLWCSVLLTCVLCSLRKLLTAATLLSCFKHLRCSWSSQQLESFPFGWKSFLLFIVTWCTLPCLIKWPVCWHRLLIVYWFTAGLVKSTYICINLRIAGNIRRFLILLCKVLQIF